MTSGCNAVNSFNSVCRSVSSVSTAEASAEASAGSPLLRARHQRSKIESSCTRGGILNRFKCSDFDCECYYIPASRNASNIILLSLIDP